MARKEFKGRLEAVGPGEYAAWTRMELPFDVEEAFGSRGRVSVSGSINGFAFRTSVFPNGDGTHHVMVNKAMKAGAKAKPGDLVRVVMERDDTPRVTALAKDVQAALKANPAAKAIWTAKTDAFRREYVDWIYSAKKPATRARRIDKMIAMVAKGRRFTD